MVENPFWHRSKLTETQNQTLLYNLPQTQSPHHHKLQTKQRTGRGWGWFGRSGVRDVFKNITKVE